MKPDETLENDLRRAMSRQNTRIGAMQNALLPKRFADARGEKMPKDLVEMNGIEPSAS
jgi:hypothetical protein